MRTIFDKILLLLPCLAALLLTPPLAESASTALLAGGSLFSVNVTSFREGRFATVIRQERDYSCGSAALATLLSVHYEDPVGEAPIFAWMYERGDQEKIRREGFSLLDLRNYLASRGYKADGFRVPLERLTAAKVPAITLIDDRGYRHFVVIKGLAGGRVLVGDPARGLKTVPQAEFEKLWSGVVFIIRNRADTGRKHFNRGPEWGQAPPAPLETAVLSGSAAPFTLLLPPLHDL